MVAETYPEFMFPRELVRGLPNYRPPRSISVLCVVVVLVKAPPPRLLQMPDHTSLKLRVTRRRVCWLGIHPEVDSTDSTVLTVNCAHYKLKRTFDFSVVFLCWSFMRQEGNLVNKSQRCPFFIHSSGAADTVNIIVISFR